MPLVLSWSAPNHFWFGWNRVLLKSTLRNFNAPRFIFLTNGICLFIDPLNIYWVPIICQALWDEEDRSLFSRSSCCINNWPLWSWHQVWNEFSVNWKGLGHLPGWDWIWPLEADEQLSREEASQAGGDVSEGPGAETSLAAGGRCPSCLKSLSFHRLGFQRGGS